MKEKNTGSRLVSSIVCALFSGIFLSSLSESWKRGFLRELLDGMLWRRMELTWRVDKQTFFMLLLCCIACAVFVISLVRCLVLIVKLIVSKPTDSRVSPASRTGNRPANGSRKTYAKKNTPTRTTTHVNGVNRGNVSSQAISCDHKNGKDKYLEQIEGFLENGLIEKSEYDILYARYKKLHISEDYH